MLKQLANILSFVLILSLPTMQAYGQYFAQLSHDLVKKKCPPVTQVDSKVQICPAQNESSNVALMKRNAGEISERATLTSLAAEKSKVFECTRSQLSFLDKNPSDIENFTRDYSTKIMLLGREKWAITQYRNKQNKTKEDIAEYEKALGRAEMILNSMPYAHLTPFKKIISHAMEQYEKYTPDRLEEWQPKQIERLLGQAVVPAMREIEENKAILDEGVATFSTSLSDAEKESLARDKDLMETFRQKHKEDAKEMEPVLCHIDAKYGSGAQYRDYALMGVSLLAVPASGLLKAGAVGLNSSIVGAATLGHASIRAGNILRLVAAVGGTAVGVSQIEKYCFRDYAALKAQKSEEENPQVCEKNILKSQMKVDCVLAAGMTALGAPNNVKVVAEFLGPYKISNYFKYTASQRDAILEAHFVGHGEKGADGTAARIGNYTFEQKLKKARILNAAGIPKADRRKLFKDGIVGESGDYLDDLAQLETQVLAKQKDTWKYGASQKSAEDELEAIRKEIDAAMDLPAEQAMDKIAKLQERLSRLGRLNTPSVRQASADDILENPDALRAGQRFPLAPEGKNNLMVSFEREALDGLLSAEKPIVQKFVSSLKMSYTGGGVDPSRLRYMTGVDSGAKGKPFEVVIISRGHQRLLGCVKDGIHTIMKYESHSPETRAAVITKFKDLCK